MCPDSYFGLFGSATPKNSPRRRSTAPSRRCIRRCRRSVVRPHCPLITVAVAGGDDAVAGNALSPARPPPPYLAAAGGELAVRPWKDF